ncbi:MAG: ABC transporter ATP-binding protein [Bacteroidales bacterium]|jgi:spermidine/putrescine transport system ATP-binding protein|nr:ABC transporter ATP-binding protein [Bacteroidales bacterium]
MAGDHIIDLRHVSKRFGDKAVLEDINLYIRKGEFVTLLGPSGCGKTTTLRLIAGFLAPEEGEILLDGKDISGIPPHKRPFNTVFQRYALFPHLDVYDNIAFGLKLQKVPTDEIDRRVRKVLKMVSMTDYEERDVDSLSGGQQQRVAIARALVNQPRILLLDEPLAALDLKMRKDMQIELKEMHRELGITFIYVTHDQEEALTLSDTIVVMDEGKIQQIGTPTDIYNEPVNSFVADFIGESNILNATMIRDRRVAFIGHEFDCVDEGFGENNPVDVVVRPEDIYFTRDEARAQFRATVRSCVFKGVHYEMYVDTDTGFELMIQNYDAYPVGSEVLLYIDPDDIQVMRKERTCNTFEGEMVDETHVKLLGGSFECLPQPGLTAGDAVTVQVDFDKVDLLDHQEEGVLAGEVHFLLYKGDHYHLTILTEDGDHIWVDTDDIWDKGDLVGVDIAPADLKICKRNEA